MDILLFINRIGGPQFLIILFLLIALPVGIGLFIWAVKQFTKRK